MTLLTLPNSPRHDVAPELAPRAPGAVVPPAGPSDGELLRAFQQGDRTAYRTLVVRHARDLLSYVTRITGDAAWSEDLTQDAFLKLYEKASTLREDERLKPWLFRVARNASLDFVRRRRLEPIPAGGDARPSGRLADVAGTAPPPSTTLEVREQGARVKAAIASLPEQFREPLVLCVLQELSYEDAAAVLGCTVKTLSSRLARARERVRELLKEARS